MKDNVLRIVLWFIGIFLFPAFGVCLEVGMKDETFIQGIDKATTALNASSNMAFLAFMIAITCILNIELAKRQNNCKYPMLLLAMELLSVLAALLCYTIYVLQVSHDSNDPIPKFKQEMFSHTVAITIVAFSIAFVAELLMCSRIDPNQAKYE